MKRTARYWTPSLARHGSVPVARIFLQAYSRLQLTTAEALLVIVLIDFKRGRACASPSLGQLSDRLGVDPRTVRAWARRLEGRGLLRRILRRQGHGREQTNLWDLGPLFQRLEALASPARSPDGLREAPRNGERPGSG